MGAQERPVRQTPLLRQKILDAARDLLAQEGYEGLSMRKVARRIDYSPTAIYLHFKDRDDLVFSVCEQLMDGLATELQQVADRHSEPLVALRKVLRRYVEFGLKHPHHYQAAFAVPHRHVVRKGVGNGVGKDVRHQAPWTVALPAFEFLPRLVAECVKRKKLAKVDVRAASCALWAGVHGLTSLLIVMPTCDGGDADRVVDQLVTMLVDGLGVRQ